MSKQLEKNISGANIANITINGIWIFVNEKEYFLPYKEYPWFKEAQISEIQNVELLHENHLRWPELDIDLEIESLEHPEEYPMIYR